VIASPPARSSTAGAVPDAPARRLGFWPTVAIVIGTIIGSGIFRMPSAVADQVGSPWAAALVWVLGGVISMCGALSLAELAAAFPRSGGVFVYLQETYGHLTAFLFGWTMLVVGPAGSAGVALICAEYLQALGVAVPADFGVRLVASMLILLVSAAAYRSVGGLGAVLSGASGAKVAAIAALVIAAFVLGDGSAGAFGAGAPLHSEARWGGVGFALVAALWAYNGFHDMVSVAGEVRDPGRALPRALLVGMLIVVVVYVAANAAYLYVLPFDQLRASPVVASDMMARVMGSAGARSVTILVVGSTFGTILALALANPRIFFAMAGTGLLFSPLSRLHPRFGTPHLAVAVHAAVALACVWLRTFEQLAAAFVLGIWPFLALAVAGVIVLRRRRPDLARPYRTPGYPLVPMVFIAGTAWVVGSALLEQPWTTLVGAGVTLVGVVPYALWLRGARV
jgi:amino acid transporter